MKKKSIKAAVVSIITTVVITTLFISGCEKEGPRGPAGADGVDANAISTADQAAYDAADGLIGGRLYDHFIKQLDITDTALANHTDFFRCKQCHGWDLRGSNGAYINRAPSVTRPAVANNDLYVYAQTHNIREIFDAIKHSGGRTKSLNTSYNGSMPDYGLILVDAKIWQIAKFIKKEVLNTFNLYDITTTGVYPTGSRAFSNIGKNGDAIVGKTMFISDCSSCHGADGTAILIDGDSYVGDFMRSSPYEFQHKARFGQPGTAMLAFEDNTESVVKDLLKAGQDAIAFPGY